MNCGNACTSDKSKCSCDSCPVCDQQQDGKTGYFITDQDEHKVFMVCETCGGSGKKGSGVEMDSLSGSILDTKVAGRS